MDTQGGNRLLTAKIVGSYLRHNKVAASQVPELIAIVHRSLGELGQQPPAEETLTPAVSVRQSVRQDYVICLDCGYRGKTLRRHISNRHGLSRAEYLSRWGLKPDHPLTARPTRSIDRPWQSNLVWVANRTQRRNPPSRVVAGKSTRTIKRNGPAAPGRTSMSRIGRSRSQRRRGEGEPVLGLAGHNLSRPRHR